MSIILLCLRCAFHHVRFYWIYRFYFVALCPVGQSTLAILVSFHLRGYSVVIAAIFVYFRYCLFLIE